MSTEKRICENCGEEFEELFETYEGQYLCEDCLERLDYEYCSKAELFVPSDEMEIVNTGTWSGERIWRDWLEDNSDKYYYCENCDEWFSEGYKESVETVDGTVCWSCYDSFYVTCQDCGAIVHYDDAYDNEDDGWLCKSCANKPKYIKNYSYKPDPKCKAKKKEGNVEYDFPDDCDELLFGAELEIDWGETPEKCAEKLCEVAPDIYIKRDGSLGNNGMEIVTHPCTLDYHMSELGWDKICSTAHDFGYSSHDTRRCGLHIHVGEHQLGADYEEREETIAKIVLIVDRFWDEMKRFSRRRTGQLRDWANAPNLGLEPGWFTKRAAKEMALYTESNGRYQAVNLTNSNTIEFRLFNGSLKPVTILATLQLVSNICSYAKENNIEQVMCSSWENIVNFKQYGALQAYLKSRGMTEEEYKPDVWFKLPPDKIEGEIEVGDRVFVTGVSRRTHPVFLDQVGTVMAIARDYYGERIYTLEFEYNFAPNYIYRIEYEPGKFAENACNFTLKDIAKTY